MLSHNMRLVYIDENRVEQEYISHLKKKEWNKEKERKDQKVIELERELASECGAGAEQEEDDKETNDEIDVFETVDEGTENDNGSESDGSDTE